MILVGRDELSIGKSSVGKNIKLLHTNYHFKHIQKKTTISNS